MQILRTPGVKLRAVLHASREKGSLQLLINPEKSPVNVIAEPSEWFIGRLENGQAMYGSKTTEEMANYLLSFSKTQLIKVILELVTHYLEIPLDYDSIATSPKKYRKLPKTNRPANIRTRTRPARQAS